ncbi:MAG: hypothetical protein QOH26_1017 [Actinomycetota bacterium]|jgi:hypothetical protein|nr:hypothetical protein [Actinomycetota bacterium]
MSERRLLMTLDEARAAFASSAFSLASSLTCSRDRTLKLLRGEGRTTGFASELRVAVLEHKRLVNALRADGLEDIIDGEIDGLASYLEVELPESRAVAG